MTNLCETLTAGPKATLFFTRFNGLRALCEQAEDRIDGEAGSLDDEADGFDAEDPRDLRVRERLSRLEAFSAA